MAGAPTTAPAIVPARSPPVEVNAQQLIALETVEAIPELELDQTANLTAEARDYQWTFLWVRMRSRSWNWSLIRRWVGNSALQEWHTRRSVSRRGAAAGRAH